MDIPRQRPQPTPRYAAPLRALRYTVVSVWILASLIGANVVMLWLVDRMTR